MTVAVRFARKQVVKISSKSDAKRRTARANPPKATVRDKALRPHKALTHALGQTEAVTGLVEEVAEDISSVNAGLKQAVVHASSPRHVKLALEISQTAESKVQEAAE